jgi:SAM-dependent methyltransferase
MILEERKKKEIEYYDEHAKGWLKEHSDSSASGDFEGFRPEVLLSYNFCYRLIERYCPGKKVLDYGCGNGVHSAFISRNSAEAVGIDLSEPSIEIARKKMQVDHAGHKTKFIKMDCEKLDFPDNSFDVIFDGGTFSSIDLEKAMPELVRVLKPNGVLIGIETFGHNPIANLKRKLNKLTGKRTGWAADHIYSMERIELSRRYFAKVEVFYFHIISWMFFPLLNISGGKKIYYAIEQIDNLLFEVPFLRKYAFKVVIVLSGPRKDKV